MSKYAQLVMRLALAIGFIAPVMDRLGLQGERGTAGVAWGNWQSFVNYTGTLMPFLPMSLVNLAAIFATFLELVFALCLILGFKIRVAAIGSAGLTAVFGLCMAIFLDLYAPIGYPVFVFTGGAMLLANVTQFEWSLDKWLSSIDKN
jgi:putative oxidoreductase